MSSERKTVIFVHIPKTAGLTLYDVLNREYGRRHIYTFAAGQQRIKASVEAFKGLPEVERARYQLLRGHVPFGLHPFVPHAYAYITLLRDPVKRIISHYYYVRGNPQHELHREITSKRFRLEDYVSSGITTELDNDQTRMLSGVGDAVPVGGVSRELLDQAIDNLEKAFCVVGLTERFDETLLLMKQQLQWRTYPVYTRQNVSRRESSPDPVSPATRHLIEKQNTLDCELYEVARKRFQDDVSRLDEEVAGRFHRLNRFYAPYGKGYTFGRTLWKRIRNRFS